jgi:DNA-binding LacI/PurR family transcriptional regulator
MLFLLQMVANRNSSYFARRKFSRRKPGVERAYAYLLDVTASLGTGERLPGLAALARAAGVAPQTMLRASRKLRREGILTSRPRSGTYRSDAELPVPAVASPDALRGAHLAVQQLAAGMIHELLSGVLPPDRPLPACKELALRRGVSRSAASKALRLLERRGWLERAGRSYRSMLYSPARGHDTLLLVARGATGGAADFPRAQDHVRHLQRECASQGVRLRLVSCDRGRDYVSEARALIDPLSTPDIVLGLVLWTLTIHEPERSQVIDTCVGLGVPVAVFDEDDGDWGQARRSRKARLFTTARGRRAGRDVGRYLLGLGHRRMAFVSASHDTLSSRNRLDGLRQVCREAGAEPVEAYVTDSGRRANRELLLRATLEERIAQVLGGGRAALPTVFTSALQHAVRDDVERRVVAPLLGRALERSSATAWVTHNDVLASWAVEFLTQQGVAVPAEVSVAGFDESPRALEYDLTSYDFGGRAALRAAVTYLLRPGLMRRFAPLYEAPGTVVTRGSTAVPRK